MSNTAHAANPLVCFADATGTCSISSGVATLVNDSGEYSSVYTAVSSLNGKTLAQAGEDQLSFRYTGTPTAGSPRISLPIDTNGDGTWTNAEGYAFIGANLCTSDTNLVDPINDSNCKIFFGGDVGGYTGWAAFVEAFPLAKVGPAADVPFIIADDAGSWTVSNVNLGSEVVAPVPMAISSVLPTFTVGVEAPFTVSTVANDDTGKMVRAYFTIPAGASVTYQEQGGSYLPLTNVYGPETGFPVSDLTSNFKATFASAGTYTVTVEFRLVAGGVVVASKEITATVVAPADTIPDAFSFTDQTGVALSTVIESNTITVAGINASADVSVVGGEYSINGGAYTLISGVVVSGNTVKVRHTSSASNSTAVDTTLTIGGVSDTFTSTTVAISHGNSSGSRAATPAVPAKKTTPPADCLAGQLFSVITGRNCNAATPAVPAGKVLGADKFHFTLFMKNGSNGSEIIELQNFLNTLGDTLVVDGKFGPKTKTAVIKFQIANGLKGDGIVGPITRAVLNK